MERIDLQPVAHQHRRGQACEDIQPNVTRDALLFHEGKLIGMYRRQAPKKVAQYADIADKELRTKRVPKSVMLRVRPLGEEDNGLKRYERIPQYSTIIGACPPKPHLRRPYLTISSVHQHKSAQNYIKAMWLLALECEKVIQEYMPEQYALQKQIFEDVPKKWRFGNLFTSSIANYNIAAPYHQDSANIPNTVNCIITKRKNAKGGNLHVPEFGVAFDQCDNSLVIYPAWKSLHGVTPIRATAKGGYRNSLVFYPLKAFWKINQGEAHERRTKNR